ncbi:MAG: PHP domain-containing protein [Treponema sp.]|nr:PHP domain-containing protein [Treponema sp.]
MAYLYETHLHTTGVSKCAVSLGADYITSYIDKGYSGMIVTDHFYNANCALSRKLPWNDWVNRFCRGYEEAKEEGDRQGFDVFFGWEETFESCDDYLIYGLDKAWLLEHPEVRKWTRGEQYRAVRQAGGCVVQAHPFRQRYYIPRVVLSAGCVDGIEAANGGHEDVSFDALAYHYAKKLGKPVTAGTDIHDANAVYYGATFGVYSDKKLNNISDYVKMILNNNAAGIKLDNETLDFRSGSKEPERFKLNGSEEVRIPVEIRDGEDRVTGGYWKNYL